MKKKLFLTVVLSFASYISLISQDNSCDDLKSFISFFDKSNSEITSPEKFAEIPLNLSVSILGDKIIDKSIIAVKAVAIFDSNPNVVSIIEIVDSAKDYSSSYDILLFSKNCTLIKSKILGLTTFMDEYGNECLLNMINDSLLEVKTKYFSHNSDDKEEILFSPCFFYLINSSGFESISLSKPSKGRLFPQASSEVIDLQMLTKMSIDDLYLMRNEIYADYGYIFPTNKWERYFQKQKWYTPRYKEVSKMMTIIEKINLDNISKLLK
jgi:hypothetical protein